MNLRLPGVDSADFLPMYLLVSDEPIWISRALKKLKDAVVPENSRGFNLDVVSGKGLSGKQVTALAQTLPMMAQRRMILIQDIHLAAAVELSELLLYLESPNPSTVITAVATKVDKRVKFYAKAKKKGVMFEFKAPRNPGDWIRQEADEKGVQLKRGAERRLADVIGNDLSRLAMAIEQLALYAGDEAISSDHVDELIANTREQTVFELTDAVDAVNRQHALSVSTSLFANRQSAIGVLVMLARHVRQIGLMHVAKHEKLSGGDLAKRVGVPPFVIDKLKRASGTYNAKAIATIAMLIADADMALKGGNGLSKSLGRQLAEKSIVETLLLDIMALAK